MTTALIGSAAGERLGFRVDGMDCASCATKIRGALELPAKREQIELHTLDGLTLVGELALPARLRPRRRLRPLRLPKNPPLWPSPTRRWRA